MNWIDFLDEHRIEWSDTDPRSTGANIITICPMCGAGMPPAMSISLVGKGWRCWRRPDEHFGHSPLRLIMMLIDCSYEQARLIAGMGKTLPSEFLATMTGLLVPIHASPRLPPPLELPDSFLKFSEMPSARPFNQYLKERGVENPLQCTKKFDMYYCLRGPFRWRIIFTIYQKGRLKTWTGRGITDRHLRYRALSPKSENPPVAHGATSEYLLWHDHLVTTDAETIVLTEGPFDSLKVRLLGERHGITSTCFFTSTPTTSQVALLHDVLPRFRRRVLLLDRGTLGAAMRVRSTLVPLDVEVKELPHNIKDPAELNVETFKFLLH